MTKMRYTIEQVEQLAQRLRALPEVEKPRKDLSKQEAISMLAKEIIVLQKRGYTLEQISEILCGEGLEITTATLRNYLQRAKQKTSRTVTTGKRRGDASGEKSNNPAAAAAPKNQPQTTFG